jgi:hypothetical protein
MSRKFEYFGEKLNQMLTHISEQSTQERAMGLASHQEDTPPGQDTTLALHRSGVNSVPEYMAPADMISMAQAQAMTHLNASQISDLAKEMALFGDAFGVQVKRAYALSDDAFNIIKRTPVYIAAFKKAQQDVVDNDALPIQLMARKMLLGHLVTLDKIAKSGATEPQHRLKAVDLLSDLADTSRPRAQKNGTMTAVNINFGAGLGSNLSKAIVVESEPV